MTKKLKSILITILSAILCFMAVFFVAPKIAFAESKSDCKMFKSLDGVRISSELKVLKDGNYLYPMMFAFEVKEGYTHHVDIEAFCDEILEREGGKIDHENTYQVFEFTLRERLVLGSEVGENAVKNILTMRLVFGFLENGYRAYAVSLYRHSLTHTLETFEIPTYKRAYTSEAGTTAIAPEYIRAKAKEGGFTLVHSMRDIAEKGPELYQGALSVVTYLPSYEKNYDVQVKYNSQRQIKKGLFGWTKKSDDFKASPETSVTRNIKEVVKGIYEDEALETFFKIKAREEALLIATGIRYEDILVSYLVQIGDTPFATMTTQEVKNVPVIGNSVNIEDVKTIANTDFPIFDTKAHSFVYQSGKTYKANYITDSKVTAKTKEGKTITFYFDLNYSLGDVFLKARDEGLISQQDFEYALNEVYVRYPETMGSVDSKLFYESEIYGRFGVISFPDVNVSLEGFFTNLFDKTTSATHLEILNTVNGVLTEQQYRNLLAEERYSTYQAFWETLFVEATGTTYDATHYLFFAAPGEGTLEEESPIEDIKDGSKDLFAGITGFFKNAGSIFGGFFGSKGGLVSILVIAVLGVGVYVAFRLGAFNGIFKGGKSSKKRRK